MGSPLSLVGPRIMKFLALFCVSEVVKAGERERLLHPSPRRNGVGMVLKLLNRRNSCGFLFYWIFSFQFFSSCLRFSLISCCFPLWNASEFLAERKYGNWFWSTTLEHRWISSVHKAMGGFSHFYTLLRIKCFAMDTIFNNCKCSREASINIFAKHKYKREREREYNKCGCEWKRCEERYCGHVV